MARTSLATPTRGSAILLELGEDRSELDNLIRHS